MANKKPKRDNLSLYIDSLTPADLQPQKQEAARGTCPPAFFETRTPKEEAPVIVIKESIKNAPRSIEEQHKKLDDYLLTVRKKNDRKISEKENSIRKLLKPNKKPKKINITEEEPELTHLPKSLDLSKFLLYNIDVTVSILESMNGENQQEICTSILTLFMSNRVEKQLIMHCIKAEFEKNENATTLFRDNGAGTLLLSTYCKRVGINYLRVVLGSFYGEISQYESAIEVDPNRCPESSLDSNTNLLYTLINNLLDIIFNSINQFPPHLISIFNEVYGILQEKHPGHTYQILGGFFFLRYFCPLFITPTANKIIYEGLTASCTRTLILMSKIIQNMSNQAMFKEAYMRPFNEVITNRKEDMQYFLYSITQLPIPIENSLGDHKLSSTAVNKSLRIIVANIIIRLDKMKSFLQKDSQKQAISQLEGILAEIELIEPIGFKLDQPPVERKAVLIQNEEVNKEAFLTLREGLQQCEEELLEVKVRLDEETHLRKSMQLILIQLADQMQTQIDTCVQVKLDMILQQVRESLDIDQEFCDMLLSGNGSTEKYKLVKQRTTKPSGIISDNPKLAKRPIPPKAPERMQRTTSNLELPTNSPLRSSVPNLVAPPSRPLPPPRRAPGPGGHSPSL